MALHRSFNLVQALVKKRTLISMRNYLQNNTALFTHGNAVGTGYIVALHALDETNTDWVTTKLSRDELISSDEYKALAQSDFFYLFCE